MPQFAGIIAFDNKKTVVALLDHETGGFGNQLYRLGRVHVIKIDRHITADSVGNKDVHALLARQHLHHLADIELIDGERNLASVMRLALSLKG